MNILFTICTFISISLFTIFLTFFVLIVRIYTNKSINNPKFPPVKGTVLHLLFHYNEINDYLTKVAKTHSTFRLLAPAQSIICTNDPKNIEHVLKNNFNIYPKGENNKDIMSDLFGDGIFGADGEKWRQQRKLASFEFSKRVLRDYSSSVFRRNAAKLVRAILGFSITGQVFDMQNLLMRSTLDSIFEVGFGVELNCLDGSSEEAMAVMKAFDASSASVFYRFVDPLWKLKRFLNIGSEASFKKHIKVVDDFVHQTITKKRELLALPRDGDILSRFLMESKKDPEKMNEKYLRDIILNFMFAGKDSGAGTLSWFFYMLCKNSLVQEKVHQEVRDVVGENGADIDDFVANISESNLEQMHYLHAALTETLRLYPAVPA
ncbi:hypothetical protein UlMin_043879, partial [Ulmus minor]